MLVIGRHHQQLTPTTQVLSENHILSAPVLQDGLEFIGFVDTHDLLRGLIKHVYPELLEEVRNCNQYTLDTLHTHACFTSVGVCAST